MRGAPIPPPSISCQDPKNPTHRADVTNMQCSMQALCHSAATSAAELPTLAAPAQQRQPWVQPPAAGGSTLAAAAPSGAWDSFPGVSPAAGSGPRGDASWRSNPAAPCVRVAGWQQRPGAQIAHRGHSGTRTGGGEPQRGYATTKHFAPSQAVRESVGHQMLRSFVDSPGMLAEPYT